MQVGEINTNNIAPKTGVTFKGTSTLTKADRIEALEKNIVKSMPKSISAITKMSKFTGEIPTIIINAIGTAFVAPVFIKYNFLSKTDDDTRTYSALRQPISAVLSVATSVAVVSPFNKFFNNLSKNGYFFKLDDFKSPSTQFNKPSDKLDKIVESAKNGEISYKSGNKKITLSVDEMKKLIDETIDDSIGGIEEDLARNKTERIGKQITRGEYYRNNKSDVKKVLAELTTELNSNKSEKELSKAFESKIKALKKSKADTELIDIVEDIYSRRDISGMKAKISKIDTACTKFAKYNSMEEVARDVASKIDIDNGVLKEEKEVLEQMKKDLVHAKSAKGVKSPKGVKSIQEILGDSNKIKGSTLIDDVVQKHIGKIEANLKGFKNITNLVLSLAILPVACSLLNYIYPRFMDAFFPRLSDKKKSKSKPADTFQKTPQPANVQKGGN